LRAAFDATMQDAAFIKDASDQKFIPKPRNGAYLDALIRKVYATPPALVDRVGALLR
jgi:hypothetical protein